MNLDKLTEEYDEKHLARYAGEPFNIVLATALFTSLITIQKTGGVSMEAVIGSFLCAFHDMVLWAKANNVSSDELVSLIDAQYEKLK